MGYEYRAWESHTLTTRPPSELDAFADTPNSKTKPKHHSSPLCMTVMRSSKGPGETEELFDTRATAL